MAGLRERQKRDREARILRTAAKLFAKRGYDQTTIPDIASRAGLAVGTIYNYFPSKPEIVLAIVRHDAVEALGRAEQIRKGSPRDPVAAVTALVEEALTPFARHERSLWRELVRAALADPALAAGVFATDLRLIGEIGALLRELQARGDLRDDVDPGRAAIAIYGVFFSWFLAFVAIDAMPLAALRRETANGIELVMHGLLQRAPTRRKERP